MVEFGDSAIQAFPILWGQLVQKHAIACHLFQQVDCGTQAFEQAICINDWQYVHYRLGAKTGLTAAV